MPSQNAVCIRFVTIAALALWPRQLVAQDANPPQLVSFSISPLIADTTAGSATFSVRIVASDDLSGFGGGGTGNGSIDIRHSSGGNPFGRGSLPITGGTSLDPVFEFMLTAPQFSPPGTYPINLTLVDNVFNTATFSPAALASLGFPSAITITGVGDTTAPRLVSFSISPLIADTNAGPATFSVRIVASDDLSGFGGGGTGNGSIDIRHSSGGNPFGRGSLPITGGTSLDPVFEFMLTAPQFSPPGTYPINVALVDNLFNTATFSPAALASLGFPSAITITGVGDTTAPRLVSFSISPLIADTNAGPATFSVRIVASDDLSGFGGGGTGNGSIDIRHSSGGNPFGRGSLPITGGTLLDPVFEFTLTAPQFSLAGTYPVSLVLVDNAFNTATFSSAALAQLGFPSAITIISFATVAIDIKPGSFPNTINLRFEGTVPVAIFSSGNFNATSVDPSTVTLAGAPVSRNPQGRLRASFDDVNGDSLLDLVVHFVTAALQLTEIDTEAALEGKTFGGTPIKGMDSVRVIR